MKIAHHLAAASAAALLILAAGTPAQADSGDGLARACESWIGDQGKQGPLYAGREQICTCLEKRVKADPNMTARDRDIAVQIFRIMARDRAKAGSLTQSMSEKGRTQVSANLNVCARQALKR